jgi:hypothetical protein
MTPAGHVWPFDTWLAVGIGAGLLGLHVYGLTDALTLGAKPGVALWLALGLLASLAKQPLEN